MGFHFGDAIEDGTLEIELHHHTQIKRRGFPVRL